MKQKALKSLITETAPGIDHFPLLVISKKTPFSKRFHEVGPTVR